MFLPTGAESPKCLHRLPAIFSARNVNDLGTDILRDRGSDVLADDYFDQKVVPRP